MCFSNQCKEKDIFQLPLCHKFLSPRKTYYTLSAKTRRFRWIWVNCCRSLSFETGPYRPLKQRKPRVLTQPVQTLFSPGYTAFDPTPQSSRASGPTVQSETGHTCPVGIKRLFLSKPQTQRQKSTGPRSTLFFHQHKKINSNCDLLHRVVFPPISWDNGIDQFPASGTQLRRSCWSLCIKLASPVQPAFPATRWLPTSEQMLKKFVFLFPRNPTHKQIMKQRYKHNPNVTVNDLSEWFCFNNLDATRKMKGFPPPTERQVDMEFHLCFHVPIPMGRESSTCTRVDIQRCSMIKFYTLLWCVLKIPKKTKASCIYVAMLPWGFGFFWVVAGFSRCF